MFRKVRRPSPAMAVALLALFVALTGTAIAADAVPLAKRALTADKAKVAVNARKLNGQTASQIAATPGPATDAATLNGQTAAQIAATPGPTSSMPAGLFTYRTDSFSVDGGDQVTKATASCRPGEKAVAGGFDQEEGAAFVLTNRPVPDGTGWRFIIWGNSDNDLPAVGTVWVICARVS